MDEKLLLGFINETMNNFKAAEDSFMKHTNVIDTHSEVLHALTKRVNKLNTLTGFGLVLSAALIWSLVQQIRNLQAQVDAIKKEQSGTDVDQEV